MMKLITFAFVLQFIDPEKFEESCTTWLASRNALDPSQTC